MRCLIRLSRNLPVQAVALGEIAELDRDHWWLAWRRHAHGAQRGGALPAHDGGGSRLSILLDSAGRVMDGMHRVGKALMLGHSHVAARRFAADPAPITRIATPRRCPMTTESCPKVWLVVPCFHGLYRLWMAVLHWPA